LIIKTNKNNLSGSKGDFMSSAVSYAARGHQGYAMSRNTSPRKKGKFEIEIQKTTDVVGKTKGKKWVEDGSPVKPKVRVYVSVKRGASSDLHQLEKATKKVGKAWSEGSIKTKKHKKSGSIELSQPKSRKVAQNVFEKNRKQWEFFKCIPHPDIKGGVQGVSEEELREKLGKEFKAMLKRQRKRTQQQDLRSSSPALMISGDFFQ